MKNITIGCLILSALLLAHDAQAQAIAQEIKFASSPNPVGSGGRAVAWGGAFIAIADDATAASWNPAGLIQLETPEVSAVLSYEFREEKVSFDKIDADDDTNTFSHGEINYISAAYPFNLINRNWVASINYQRLFEFNRTLNLDLAGQRSTLLGVERFEEEATFEQLGALTTISPAISIQITPAWSAGLTLNFWGLDPSAEGWDNQVEVEHKAYFPSLPAHQFSWAYQKEEYRLNGINANLGVLWTPGRFTVGAVYKSGFEGDLEYYTEVESGQFSPDAPFLTSNVWSFSETYDEKITWPAAYGIGVAFRYSDALSFAMDLYTTEWSTFEVEDEEGNKYNLIAGRVEEKGDDVKSTIQVRAGFEYLWILERVALALRGGGFYDPAPGDDVINEFYGVSVGTGIVYKQFVTDIAFQYRWANGVEIEEVLGERGEADINEVFLIASLIYHI